MASLVILALLAAYPCHAEQWPAQGQSAKWSAARHPGTSASADILDRTTISGVAHRTQRASQPARGGPTAGVIAFNRVAFSASAGIADRVRTTRATVGTLQASRVSQHSTSFFALEACRRLKTGAAQAQIDKEAAIQKTDQQRLVRPTSASTTIVQSGGEKAFIQYTSRTHAINRPIDDITIARRADEERSAQETPVTHLISRGGTGAIRVQEGGGLFYLGRRPVARTAVPTPSGTLNVAKQPIDRAAVQHAVRGQW